MSAVPAGQSRPAVYRNKNIHQRSTLIKTSTIIPHYSRRTLATISWHNSTINTLLVATIPPLITPVNASNFSSWDNKRYAFLATAGLINKGTPLRAGGLRGSPTCGWER
ncbi:hypothetical protein E2C01_078686 [Portunus trituberculatus]|uniref:Uncharacterized protein n=1 Tax=Portunus trituberculatus TaxID=210409 RepID=A0A5B7INH2_PORTR|nr:hypothetical protein [Portunus trituberculatus]